MGNSQCLQGRTYAHKWSCHFTAGTVQWVLEGHWVWGVFCSGAAEMKPVYVLDLNVSAVMATSWWVPVYGNIAGNIINDEMIYCQSITWAGDFVSRSELKIIIKVVSMTRHGIQTQHWKMYRVRIVLHIFLIKHILMKFVKWCIFKCLLYSTIRHVYQTEGEDSRKCNKGFCVLFCSLFLKTSIQWKRSPVSCNGTAHVRVRWNHGPIWKWHRWYRRWPSLFVSFYRH